MKQNTSEIMLSNPVKTRALDAVVSREDFLKMLQAVDRAKDKAILCLALIGLRAAEIGECQASWVDLSRQTITLPPANTKRKKGRTVPFGKVKVVSEVLTAFFALEKGINLSRVAVWGAIKRAGTAAGVTHTVTPHGLRATGATWMAQAGYSLTGLMDHFGWSELRTAQHYVRASGASSIRDMEEKGAKVL